jgi:hypothetical protein
MPLPEGMVKLQEMPVGLDWQLVKARLIHLVT